MKALTRSWPLFLIVVFCCSVLAGCGIMKAKEDADKVLTTHFQALSTNGYDAALAGYGSQFFQKTSKDDWGKSLARLTSKLGTYKSHSITGWRAFSQAGTSGAGTTVTLQCQVAYSKHSAQETFTLFKGASDAEYKIIGHHIDGAALLAE